MRTKAVPPAPDDLGFLEEAQAAVPLVPEPEESCCVRLASRLAGVNKDDARTWLAFLEALSLVEEGELGYVRTRTRPTADSLREPFRTRVFGVEEVLTHLGETGHADVDAVFNAVEDHVPQWERHRNPGSWQTIWRDRVADLLEWARLFGLVTTADGSYTVATD